MAKLDEVRIPAELVVPIEALGGELIDGKYVVQLKADTDHLRVEVNGETIGEMVKA